MKNNNSVKILGYRNHSKASERYVDVRYEFEANSFFETSVPIIYRRTGTEIEDKDIPTYLEKIYSEINPKNWPKWRTKQEEFWNDKPRAIVTKEFFDVLAKKFKWCCVNCAFPSNPNWARRTQDIKEFGYTLATKTKHHCPKCKSNKTHIILLPISRGGITGYETWSAEVREKIIQILNVFDAYECKDGQKAGLLPDHKFPEIRWDGETRRDSLKNLSDEEILRDFQLLSNQRNQQKREVCRKCYNNGQRGIIYGIEFYYQGDKIWDEKIPKNGKKAEEGCKGCPWYDIVKWRTELLQHLSTIK